MLSDLWKAIQNLAQGLFRSIRTISDVQYQVISNVFLAIIGKNIEISKLNENVEKTNKTIEKKIEEAQESLVNTSKVINELNELIANNQKELKFVQSEYERFAALKKLSLEEAGPLLNEIDSTLKKDTKKNHFISFIISFIFFLAGALFGPWIYNLFTGIF